MDRMVDPVAEVKVELVAEMALDMLVDMVVAEVVAVDMVVAEVVEVGEGGEQGGGTSSTLGWVGFYRKLKVSGVFCLINILFE